MQQVKGNSSLWNEKIAIISLGCPKNRVDSEIIAARLGLKGYILTDFIHADTVILNTCSFIKSAVEEAEEWMEKIIKSKKNLIVIGCLVERFGEKIRKVYPKVKQVIGIDGYFSIEDLIHSGKSFYSNGKKWLPSSQMPRLLSTPFHYAYLKIADGCSNNCSYCTIPFIRGKLRSRRINDILEEVKMLVENGVKEIIIIAHDPTSYGIDIYGEPKLVELLKKIEKVKNIKWIRLLYLYPGRVDEKLINIIVNSEKILKYIDIPIQHVSNSVLKKMGRRYNKEFLKRLIMKLKNKDFVLRTTIMVGFPGEGEKDFKQLKEFLLWAEFDHLGVFKYSDEPETAAFSMDKKQNKKIIEERFQEVISLQKSIVEKKNKQLSGKILEGVVDSTENTVSYGRTWQDAPEIDREVIIKRRIPSGTFLRFKIQKTEGYKLYADSLDIVS